MAERESTTTMLSVKTIITPEDDNKAAAPHYNQDIIVTGESFPHTDAKHILLSAVESHHGLSFFPFFLSLLSAIVQFLFPPTDDWFKRPGALQRLLKKSSLQNERAACVCVRSQHK